MSVEITAGCIRFYETGPEWHVNDHHKAIGLIDPTVQPYIDGDGRLAFSLVGPTGQPNTYPVCSMTVEEDETLTARGVTGGPSGGVTEVRIQFYKNGVNGADGVPISLDNPTHYSRIQGPNSNIWFTALHLLPV
jgi:hypothetical protein